MRTWSLLVSRPARRPPAPDAGVVSLLAIRRIRPRDDRGRVVVTRLLPPALVGNARGAAGAAPRSEGGEAT